MRNDVGTASGRATPQRSGRFDLSGKVAVIVGGSRGIGAAIVRKLAASGANVAFSYRSSRRHAKRLECELRESSHTVVAVEADA